MQTDLLTTIGEAGGETDGLLQAVLQSLPYAVFWKDQEGRFLGCNAAAVCAFGVDDPADVIGKTDFDLPSVTRKQAEAFRAKDREIITSGSAEFGIIEAANFADGRVRWLETDKLPLRNAQGDIIGVLGNWKDITEEKNSREALIDSENRFRELAENIHEAFWVSTPDKSQLLYISPAYEKIWRRTCRSLHTDPNSWMEAIHPDDRERVTLNLADRQLLGDYDVEYRIIVGEGFTRWIHERAYPVTDEDGNAVRIVGVAEDITANKQAEESVRKLAAFPRLNPNPVMELQPGGVVSYWNDAAEDMTRSLDAKKLTDLLPDKWESIVAGCLVSGASRSAVDVPRNGRILTCSFFPIAALNAVHCYVTDVTEQRRLADQYRQSQKMETIGTLASGVAHDFNNLLTVIQGNLSMLQEPGGMANDSEELIEDIADAAAKAASLTRQLLVFSRQEQLRLQSLDLADSCRQLKKMLRRLLGETIEVRMLCPDGLPPVHADPGMVDQILLNLAVNARDAMPQGGELRIAVQHAARDARGAPPNAGPNTHLCLIVADAGQGIPADVLPRIFDPFFTTKGVGQGTGLGLATVHGIVSQHGGWIDVDSTPENGTAFRVYLPIACDVPHPASIDRSKSNTGRGQTILLVEDDDTVRELGRKLLSRAGYHVLIAANGPRAVEVFEQESERIELLVSDVVMPGAMTGHELARRLTAEKPDLRVLLMSGYFREECEGPRSSEHDFSFLQKPFFNQALLEAVAETLRV